MRLGFITLTLLLSFWGNLNNTIAQTKAESFFDYEFGYTGDFMSNLKGGIKTGDAYLGMVTLQLTLSTEEKGWWRGGEFAILGSTTHGDEPSANLIGDLQVASNIEAGNHTYVQELWFKQQLGSVSVKAGLQDMNAEMAFSSYAQNLLNSSFGIHATISDNVPSPIFPLTALGVTVGWDITENLFWQTAIYDGKTHDFNNNPYNTHWKLGADDGYLAITEFQYNGAIFGELENSYKFGFYHHDHDDFRDDLTSPNYGFYTVLDQQLAAWNETGSLATFFQCGLSSTKKNNLHNYIGLGFEATGICQKRANDIVSLGVVYAALNEGVVDYEATIEMTYAAQLTNQITIQPDLQYIINPAGTDNLLDDAFVASLRLSISY